MCLLLCDKACAGGGERPQKIEVVDAGDGWLSSRDQGMQGEGSMRGEGVRSNAGIVGRMTGALGIVKNGAVEGI